jgi:hypothetical protein
MLGEPHSKGGHNVPVWIEYRDKGIQVTFQGLSFEVSFTYMLGLFYLYKIKGSRLLSRVSFEVSLSLPPSLSLSHLRSRARACARALSHWRCVCVCVCARASGTMCVCVYVCVCVCVRARA